MSVVVGTNAGFVTVAPTADPADTNSFADSYEWAQRDTAPEGATKITQVGWWCDTASEETNFEVGLYSDSSGTNRPYQRLFVSDTNAKGTDAGWKTVAVDWTITPGVVYWIAVQVDNVTTTTYTNVNLGGGSRSSSQGSVTTLPSSWPGGSSSVVYPAAVYAVYTSTETLSVTGTSAATSSVSGSVTVYNVVSVTGTSAATSTVTMTASTVTPNWQTDTFKNTKRLVIAGNDSIWYEDI